jgi:hypothetical protein
MPKLGEMAQLARPFQIALVAVLALAMMVLAWFTLLHRSSTEPTASSSPPSAASAAANATASSSAGSPGGAAAAAGSGHVYHGPVPGLEGLTRDVKRAHEAAAKEERGVGYQEAHAGQTHSSTASAAAAPSTATHAVLRRTTTRQVAHGTTVAHRTSTQEVVHHTTSHTSAGASSSVRSTTTVHTRHTDRVKSASPAATPSNSTPTMQAVVASELKQGKVVLVLFWNPHSSDDVAVEGQVKAVAHTLGRHVAMHTAYASQVNSFGSITREIQVYQTPTLMIVDPHGQVTTLTGYTDAYAIEQAIAEAGK